MCAITTHADIASAALISLGTHRPVATDGDVPPAGEGASTHLVSHASYSPAAYLPDKVHGLEPPSTGAHPHTQRLSPGCRDKGQSPAARASSLDLGAGNAVIVEESSPLPSPTQHPISPERLPEEDGGRRGGGSGGGAALRKRFQGRKQHRGSRRCDSSETSATSSGPGGPATSRERVRKNIQAHRPTGGARGVLANIIAVRSRGSDARTRVADTAEFRGFVPGTASGLNEHSERLLKLKVLMGHVAVGAV